MPEITSKGPGDRQLPPIERLDPPDPAAAVRLRPALGVWLRDLIVSLAISAFIIVFIYQPVKVEGTSMMPSLQDQERISVNKSVYRLERISRGEVVVSHFKRISP